MGRKRKPAHRARGRWARMGPRDRTPLGRRNERNGQALDAGEHGNNPRSAGSRRQDAARERDRLRVRARARNARDLASAHRRRHRRERAIALPRRSDVANGQECRDRGRIHPRRRRRRTEEHDPRQRRNAVVSRAKRPMAVTGPSTGQARFDMILWTYCRRAPREPAGELQAIVFVPMHPDDPDLPGMLSPTHWILGLGGREFDYADVTLQIEDRQVNAQIKHRRIAGYGRPRPESEGDYILDCPSRLDRAALGKVAPGPEARTPVVFEFPVLAVLHRVAELSRAAPALCWGCASLSRGARWRGGLLRLRVAGMVV